MNKVARVRFENPVLDPVSGQVRQDFASGIAHNVTREGDVFTIEAVQTGATMICNVRASWIDVIEAPAPEPVPAPKAKRVSK